MPCAFVVNPVAKTVTPCAPNTIDQFKNRVGQARHDVTFCTETSDGCLVELTGVVWPWKDSSVTFEFCEMNWRGTAVVVVDADDDDFALPVAFSRE